MNFMVIVGTSKSIVNVELLYVGATKTWDAMITNALQSRGVILSLTAYFNTKIT